MYLVLEKAREFWYYRYQIICTHYYDRWWEYDIHSGRRVEGPS